MLPLAAVAVCILTTGGVKAATENDGACSKLQAKIDRLYLEIALVKAELGSHCRARNESEARIISEGVGQLTKPEFVDVPIQQSTQPVLAGVKHAKPTRRRRGDAERYAVHCWAAGSAFADPSCNCLGEPPHPLLGSRRTTRIVVGSWHASSDACHRHL